MERGQRRGWSKGRGGDGAKAEEGQDTSTTQAPYCTRRTTSTNCFQLWRQGCVSCHKVIHMLWYAIVGDVGWIGSVAGHCCRPWDPCRHPVLCATARPGPIRGGGTPRHATTAGAGAAVLHTTVAIAVGCNACVL